MSDYHSRHQTSDAVGYKGFHQEEGLGDGWMRLMTFDMTAATPKVHVHTYSTHYGKESREVAEYAAWYRADEKPQQTEASSTPETISPSTWPTSAAVSARAGSAALLPTRQDR